jgi:hypothetical protein
MNRLFLWAGLLLGLAGNAVAQRDRIKERRSQYEIRLPNRNRLVVVFNTWPELAAHRNLDSLLRLFVADWRLWRDTTGTRTDARRVTYTVEPGGARTARVATFALPTETYQFRSDEEPVQLKTALDTLVIEKRLEPGSRTTKPAFDLPLNVQFCFYLNRLEDIEALTKQGLNGELEKAIGQARAYTGHDLFLPRYWSAYSPEPGQRRPWRVGGFNEGQLVLSPGVGVGVARNQLYTALVGDLGLRPGQTLLGLRLGWHEYVFFEPRGDGTTRIVRNSFLNAGIMSFRLRPAYGDLPHANGASLTLGYLIRRNGDFFEKNTFRLAGTVNLFRWSKIEPELYWNGFFKNVYPGLRLNVGF